MASNDQNLRIFISSTAEDLENHRNAVANAIERLGQGTRRMETFGARPVDALSECKRLARTSDAVVVIVAHRYGWIPSQTEGGDGEKSITWHEVEAALSEKLPVFAFIVDENAEWNEAKEQDRIVGASQDEIDAIYKSVQMLQRFKEWLSDRRVRDTFTTPSDLAQKVVTSLGRWLLDRTDKSLPLDRYLDYDLTDVCNRTYRQNITSLEFHPRDHFVPIAGSWGATSKSDDLVPDLVARYTHGRRERCAIIADYGQGKTFVSWRLALTLAKSQQCIPLFYSLKAYSPHLEETPLVQIDKYMRERYSALDVLRLLDERACLLILDGADEMPNKHAASMHLSSIFDSLRPFPRLSILLTFREGLFHSDRFSSVADEFSDFSEVRLTPWGSYHWEQLLHTCWKTGYVPFKNGEKGVAEFNSYVQESRLKSLITRPLWCRLIIDLAHTGDIRKLRDIGDEVQLFNSYVTEYFDRYMKKSADRDRWPTERRVRILELAAVAIARENALLQNTSVTSEAQFGDDQFRLILGREFGDRNDDDYTELLIQQRTHSLRARPL